MTHELLDGFKRFKNKEYAHPDTQMNRLVRDGQDPKYFIISCIDSRSNPGIVFDTGPGAFFSHKAMAAIVRPYKKGTALSAALQFALNHNHVEDIIVLGHTKCGAIEALVNGISDEEISEFLQVANEGMEVAKVKCECCTDRPYRRHVKEQIILKSAENLKGYPAVKHASSKREIRIHPWIFDMEAAGVHQFNTKTDQFDLIS